MARSSRVLAGEAGMSAFGVDLPVAASRIFGSWPGAKRQCWYVLSAESDTYSRQWAIPPWVAFLKDRALGPFVPMIRDAANLEVHATRADPGFSRPTGPCFRKVLELSTGTKHPESEIIDLADPWVRCAWIS